MLTKGVVYPSEGVCHNVDPHHDAKPVSMGAFLVSAD